MSAITLEKDIFDAVHDQHPTGKTMREVLNDFFDGLAKAECKRCKCGDPPSLRGGKHYMHRLPEGKNGGLINVLCRAAEIRKAQKELNAEEPNA